MQELRWETSNEVPARDLWQNRRQPCQRAQWLAENCVPVTGILGVVLAREHFGNTITTGYLR
jgi:hypothetical protein